MWGVFKQALLFNHNLNMLTGGILFHTNKLTWIEVFQAVQNFQSGLHGLLRPGDSRGRTNRLYLIYRYSKQPLPPGRPSSGFVDSSAAQLDGLSTEGSEKTGEGEWRRAAGPDGVLSRFVWDDKANEKEQWNPCEVRMSHVIIILCLGLSIPVINNTFCP